MFKKYLFFVFVLILSLSNTFANDLIKTEFTNKPFIDLTNSLNNDENQKINQSLIDYSEKNNQPFKILMIESTGGEDINKLTTNIFNSYGFGSQKNNNAIFILISKEDKKFNLKTGLDLNDKFNQTRISTYITPCVKSSFPREQYYKGISCMIKSSQSLMYQINQQESSNNGFILFLVCVILFSIVIILIFNTISKPKKYGNRTNYTSSNSSSVDNITNAYIISEIFSSSGIDSSNDGGGSTSSDCGGGGGWGD